MATLPPGLTPEMLPFTPASMPPPGVVPNFENPYSAGKSYYVASGILTTIMLVFVTLRFYTKLFIWKKTTLDDWTTLLGAILTLGFFGICTWCIEVAKFGTHMWDMSLLHILQDDFVIAGFLANWPTAIIWGVIKSSFFIMYIQVFNPFKWIRLASIVGLVINCAFYLAIMIATIYFTAPHGNETWGESIAHPRQQHNFEMTIPTAAGSLFLDVYILVLPLLAIGQLKMNTAKKLGVMVVFATGIGACVASSLAIYYKTHLNANTNDYTYHVLPVLITSTAEMCIGITCCSMPSCAHFFKNTTGNTTRGYGSSGYGGKASYGSKTNGSYPLRSIGNKFFSSKGGSQVSTDDPTLLYSKASNHMNSHTGSRSEFDDLDLEKNNGSYVRTAVTAGDPREVDQGIIQMNQRVTQRSNY